MEPSPDRPEYRRRTGREKREAFSFAERAVLLGALNSYRLRTNPGYPAAPPNVIAAASDRTIGFSVYGDYVDGTPGTNAPCTPHYGYKTDSGTSMFSPASQRSRTCAIETAAPRGPAEKLLLS